MDNDITIRYCNNKMATDPINKQIRAPIWKQRLENRGKLSRKKMCTDSFG